MMMMVGLGRCVFSRDGDCIPKENVNKFKWSCQQQQQQERNI